MDENDILTYEGLSVLLKRNVNTLRHDVGQRRIPYIKLGTGKNAQVRFIRSDIEAWLQSNRVPVDAKGKK